MFNRIKKNNCNKQKKYDADIQDYLEAMNTESNAIQHIKQGNIYLEIGKFDAAITEYKHAINLEPNHNCFSLLLSYAYRQRANTYIERPDLASADYHEAIRLNPNDSGAYCDLANFYYKHQQYNNAIQALNELLKMDPHYRHAYYMLGHSYKELLHTDLAIKNFSAAVACEPHVDRYEYYRYGLNSHELSKARRMGAADMKMCCYYWLGQCYEALGDNDLAKQNYVNALQLVPSDKRSIDALTKIERHRSYMTLGRA